MPPPSQRPASKPVARPQAAAPRRGTGRQAPAARRPGAAARRAEPSDKRFERRLALGALGALVVVLGLLGYRAWHRSAEIARLTDAAFSAYEARTQARLRDLTVGHVLTGPMVECVREGVAMEQRRQTGSLVWSPERIAHARLANAKSRCLENFLMRSELYATRTRRARSEMREAILLGLGD